MFLIRRLWCDRSTRCCVTGASIRSRNHEFGSHIAMPSEPRPLSFRCRKLIKFSVIGTWVAVYPSVARIQNGIRPCLDAARRPPRVALRCDLSLLILIGGSEDRIRRHTSRMSGYHPGHIPNFISSVDSVTGMLSAIESLTKARQASAGLLGWCSERKPAETLHPSILSSFQEGVRHSSGPFVRL
ncbi:hypothetical protein BDW74DRAFT_17541 [Aspergillus multicolor]|uniref:uncharacterized protein n=1 Tax=Aspergillus multicolor TaxID=41759 RepID=UPI003CCDE20E